MTGIAIAGCTFENVVGMTTQARNSGMLTCQFESGQVVVIEGWFPGGCVVAGIASSAKRPLVSIF